MNVVEALTQARDLIKDRSKWTTGVYARDRADMPIAAQAERAVCFCSTGALIRVTGLDHECIRGEALAILETAAMSMGENGPEGLNDRMGHAKVMEMFDRAIAHAGIAQLD